MVNTNALIQEALELVSMVGDGEAADGTLAASALALLNRGIATLNQDNYFATAQDRRDAQVTGELYFRKLEEGEVKDATIDMEPPEAVISVSRQVGVRFVPMRPSNDEEMDRYISQALPVAWTYSTREELTPSGEERTVGILRVNGKGTATVRIYFNHVLKLRTLYDNIPVSPLYHDALLYTLADLLCTKYKLADYAADMARLKSVALSKIDVNTLSNRQMNNDIPDCGNYDDAYYDGLGGNGFSVG